MKNGAFYFFYAVFLSCLYFSFVFFFFVSGLAAGMSNFANSGVKRINELKELNKTKRTRAIYKATEHKIG